MFGRVSNFFISFSTASYCNSRSSWQYLDKVLNKAEGHAVAICAVQRNNIIKLLAKLLSVKLLKYPSALSTRAQMHREMNQ